MSHDTPDLPQTKLCPKCNTRKPVTDFYPRKGRRCASYCKPCSSDYVSARVQAKRLEARKEDGRDHLYKAYDPALGRTCTKCKRFKFADDFSKDGKTGMLSSWCKECVNANARAHHRRKRMMDPDYKPFTPAIYTYDPKVGRTCSVCKEFKTADEFSKGRTAGTLVAACKVCHNKRIARLPNGRAYGLKDGDYERMYEEQNGCCKICGCHSSQFMNRLSIDHCHKTGKVRGLLCIHCNHGIGAFFDNPELLASAIRFLEEAAGK